MSKGIPSTKARHGIYIDQPLMDAVKRDALKQRRSVNFIIGEALREKYGRAGHSTKGDHVVVYDRPAVDDDPGEDPGILG